MASTVWQWEAYIANLAESSNCIWESILDNLGELAGDLGVATIDHDGNEVETVSDMLKILAPHFNAVEDADLIASLRTTASISMRRRI